MCDGREAQVDSILNRVYLGAPRLYGDGKRGISMEGKGKGGGNQHFICAADI